MKATGLSFVVPVRNDAERLRVSLASIVRSARQADVPFEILVADNGSADHSVLVAREAGATVLELPDSKVSAMRNAAARRARFELVAFVDADNEIAPEWVASMLEAFDDNTVGACGSPYSCPVGGTWVQRAYDLLRPKPSGSEDVEWLGSGNLAIRKKAFAAVNGFDATLTTCEDVDLCQRLIRQRIRLVSVAGMSSVHHGDPRTLKAVFMGELWRGRDNIRVTLREPSFRSLISLAISLLIAAGILAFFFGAWWSPWLSLLALLLVIGVIVLRAARMSATPSRRRTVSFARVLMVASAYEIGRALAIFARLSHHRRHASPAVQAHV